MRLEKGFISIVAAFFVLVIFSVFSAQAQDEITPCEGGISEIIIPENSAIPLLIISELQRDLDKINGGACGIEPTKEVAEYLQRRINRTQAMYNLYEYFPKAQQAITQKTVSLNVDDLENASTEVFEETVKAALQVVDNSKASTYAMIQILDRIHSVVVMVGELNDHSQACGEECQQQEDLVAENFPLESFFDEAILNEMLVQLSAREKLTEEAVKALLPHPEVLEDKKG